MNSRPSHSLFFLDHRFQQLIFDVIEVGIVQVDFIGGERIGGIDGIGRLFGSIRAGRVYSLFPVKNRPEHGGKRVGQIGQERESEQAHYGADRYESHRIADRVGG